jgi:DNA ligase (NAD+)
MQASQFLSKLKALDKAQLLEIKGLGSVLVDNLIEFCESEQFEILTAKFEDLEQTGKGVEIEVKDKNFVNTGELAGEVICITGSFDIPRPQIKEILEGKGARVVDSVTKSTTILLAGEDGGSKLEKAAKLGIRVFNKLSSLI